jgi:hypothetical protein
MPVPDLPWLSGVPVEPHVCVLAPTGGHVTSLHEQVRTQRGVPIHSQLRSHKLFSTHFEEFAHLVDSATLYHTGAQLHRQQCPTTPQSVCGLRTAACAGGQGCWGQASPATPSVCLLLGRDNPDTTKMCVMMLPQARI